MSVKNETNTIAATAVANCVKMMYMANIFIYFLLTIMSNVYVRADNYKLQILFIVSCSDSNRNVASKQSVFESLMRALFVILNRSALFCCCCCCCFALHLRYVRLFLSFCMAENMKESILLPEVIFLPRVPCYFLYQSNRTQISYKRSIQMNKILTYTCQYVYNCYGYVHVYMVQQYARVL